MIAELAAKRRRPDRLTNAERADRIARLFACGSLVIDGGRVAGLPRYQPIIDCLNRLIDQGYLNLETV